MCVVSGAKVRCQNISQTLSPEQERDFLVDRNTHTGGGVS